MQLTTCRSYKTVTEATSLRCFRCGATLGADPSAGTAAGPTSAIAVPSQRWTAFATNLTNTSGRKRRPSVVRLAGWILLIEGLLTTLLWFRVSILFDRVEPSDLASVKSIAMKIVVFAVVLVLAGFLVLRMSRIGWLLGVVATAGGGAINLQHMTEGSGGSLMVLATDAFILLALAIDASAFFRPRPPEVAESAST